MANLLHIKNLELAYPGQKTTVLSGLNLEVKKGEIIVLLGENGIGKSTLLKSIAGQLKPLLGTINLEDKPIESWSKKALAEKMGWVSTQLSFSEYISVEEFIAFGRYPFINWLGKLKEADLIIISKAIESCKLKHLSLKSMAHLSDGEKQKVFIARALAQETELLILDEPTTHLDVKNTVSIFALLKKQRDEFQKTIIFSSHKFENALQVANKIWLFDNKGIISCTPKEFKEDKSLQKKLIGDSAVYNKESDSFTFKL